MEYKTVIDILKRKTTIPGDGYSYEQISEAFDIAIREVGKMVPAIPVRKHWSPNLCPTCGEDLGGACDDGYYQNPWHDRCPACGQKLDYDIAEDEEDDER